MHALLLAADPRTAAGLAAAWRAGGAGTVEAGVLPTPPPAPVGAAGRPVPGAAPPPVLVPVTALLRRPPPGGGTGAGDVDAGAGAGGAAPPAWAARVAAADLVVVHLERLDALALHGPPLADVVAAARPGAVPVVVLAGRAEASRREWSAAGLSGVHEVGDDDGDRVARVAATWAPRWREASHGGRPLPHGGARA